MVTKYHWSSVYREKHNRVATSLEKEQTIIQNYTSSVVCTPYILCIHSPFYSFSPDIELIS